MKLLSKSLRLYFLYSFILVIVVIPIFYFVVRHQLLRSVDKSLRTQLHDIRSRLPEIRTPEELAIWARLDRDIRLEPVAEDFPERLHTVYHPDARHHDHDPFRELEAPVRFGDRLYRLTISSSLVENEDLLASIVLVDAALLVGLLAGMLLINRRISRTLWRPFYRTLDDLAGYDFRHHAAMRLPDSDIAEFSALNRSLESLLNRNYRNYLSQKEFSGNAAHEMQTPLAIGQSQVDLLMQTTPLSAEQAELIRALDAGLRRMTRANRSLLLLTRIENQEFAAAELIDPNEVLARLLADYHPAAAQAGLSIARSGDAMEKVKANPALAEMLIGNLLLNAIRHNVPGGRIAIETTGTGFTIRNTGTPEAADPQKIFDRFYKAAENSGGLGLGLAIVRRIGETFGWEIRYAYEGGLHTFAVRFPDGRNIFRNRPFLRSGRDD